MIEDDETPTQVIHLTEDQVQAAMLSLVEHIQTQWPNEREAENVAAFLSKEFGRNLLRWYVVHRIPDCLDINWLLANGVDWNVKSSVEQFVEGNFIRIQIFNRQHRRAYKLWRDR